MPEQRFSPLDEFQSRLATVPKPVKTGVYLSELPFLGYINLRGNPADRAFVGRTQQCLGTPLPFRPNTISQNEILTTLWLGPDEWLVVIQQSRAKQIAVALSEALRTLHVAVTDLSDGQTLLCLSGRNAQDVLQSGCSLDFHLDVFKKGYCAQTLFAKAAVILWRSDDASSFFLIVRRSFAEYLALWVQDAADPWGFEMVGSVVPPSTARPVNEELGSSKETESPG
jgi:sarcosine oxidase subunit gamma